MQHLELKAATTPLTDRGGFEALASTYGVDRQHERVAQGAFTGTIARWQASGKQLPVHWAHRGDADAVIGSVDPSTMAETSDGLYVRGQLDLEDSDTAREAWRSVKANRVGLSIGYMTETSHKEADNVTVLDEIDLFEISIVPAPANADTRILSTKAAADLDPRLVAEWKAIGASFDRATRDVELRRKADQLATEFKQHLQPVQIASFEC